MSLESLKQDAAVALGWFKISIPSLIAIMTTAYYIGTNLKDVENSIATLRKDNAALSRRIENYEKIEFRTAELEKDVREIEKVQKDLQGKFVEQFDLMRESFNKLSLQVELMNERMDSFRSQRLQKQVN